MLWVVVLALVLSQTGSLDVPWIFPNSVPDMYAHLSDIFNIASSGHIFLPNPNSHLQYPGAYALGAQFLLVTHFPLLYGYVVLGSVILLLRLVILFMLFKLVMGRSAPSLLVLGFAVVTDLVFVTYFGSESLSIPLMYLVSYGIFRNLNMPLVLIFVAQIITDPLFYISDVFLLLTIIILLRIRVTTEPQVSMKLLTYVGVLMIAYFVFAGWNAIVGISEAITFLFKNPLALPFQYISGNFVSPAVNPTKLLEQLWEIGNWLHIYVDYTVGILFGGYVLLQIARAVRTKGAVMEPGAVMVLGFVGAGLYFLFSPTIGGLYAAGTFLEVSYPMMVLGSVLLISQAYKHFQHRFLFPMRSWVAHTSHMPSAARAYARNSNRRRMWGGFNKGCLVLVLALILTGAMWGPYFSLRLTYQQGIGTGPVQLAGGGFLNQRIPAGTVFAYEPRFLVAYSYVSHVPYESTFGLGLGQNHPSIDAYSFPPSILASHVVNQDVVYTAGASYESYKITLTWEA